MKIYKLANILALPFFMGALALGYLGFQHPTTNLLVWALAPLIPLVLIYLFSPQINYWWLSKNPVKLDEAIVKMLDTTNPIYNKLSSHDKDEFAKRLTLFIHGKEFVGKGMEEDNKDVPYDIKNLLSQIPVTLTLGRKDFLLKHFDRVVLYKHPFPTPLNKFLHTVETHAEDGVVILSLEHVEKAMFQKGHHYDVAWHGFAEAFMLTYPKENYPDLPSDIWTKIEKISPQNKQQILGTLGFESIDVMPLLINLYFNYNEKFNSVLPEVKRSFDSIFNPKV